VRRGRRENFWGISCKKITILRQKIIFFPILGGERAGCAPPPLNPPLDSALSFWPINIIFGRKHYYTIIKSEFEIQINLLFFLVKSWFFIEKVHILRITHFSETTKDRSLIFGMCEDANVKLCIQHFYPRGSAPPRWEICFKKCDRDPHPKPYIFMIRVGMTPRGLSYKAFNLPSHPDHKYIWFRGGDLNY
jgi:hypothetical protein